jgi:hypothetical protein
VPEAKYLDLILYSREQLVKEYQAMPSKSGGDIDPEQYLPNVPWGIIRWAGDKKFPGCQELLNLAVMFVVAATLRASSL